MYVSGKKGIKTDFICNPFVCGWRTMINPKLLTHTMSCCDSVIPRVIKAFCI